MINACSGPGALPLDPKLSKRERIKVSPAGAPHKNRTPSDGSNMQKNTKYKQLSLFEETEIKTRNTVLTIAKAVNQLLHKHSNEKEWAKSFWNEGIYYWQYKNGKSVTQPTRYFDMTWHKKQSNKTSKLICHTPTSVEKT